MVFSETVTVKGVPRLKCHGGGLAGHLAGSGTDTLTFRRPPEKPGGVAEVDLNGGAILASEAAATTRSALLTLPADVELPYN